MGLQKPQNLTISDKNLDIYSFFEKDEGFTFVYKKTEKLVSAIYMVTNLFSENEPMKWILRKKAGTLLSFMFDRKDVLSSKYLDFLYKVKILVLEVISFLEVSFASDLISEMNFSILKQEFSSLINNLETNQNLSKGAREKSVLKGFFNNDQLNEVSEYHDNMAIQSQKTSSMSGEMFRAGNIDNKKISEISGNSRKSDRQNSIINILKKNKEATIKNIAEAVKGCSEKTIQRELVSLISNGVVQRVGKRRWSKYSLII